MPILFSDLRARFENRSLNISDDFAECVFESLPTPSTANFKFDRPTQPETTESNFENTPIASPAFTSYSKVLNSADGPYRSIFESDPVISRADYRA